MEVAAAAEASLQQPQQSVAVPQVLEGEALEQALLSQLEYYFSRENLPRDTYLVSHMDAEHYVPLEVVGQFQKISSLLAGRALSFLVPIAQRSNLLQLSDDKTKVRPSFKTQRNTVILRDMPSTTTTEKIQELFSSSMFKSISSIRPDILNCWFVVFDSEEEARQAVLWARSQSIDDQPVLARLKTETLLRGTFANYSDPVASGVVQAIPAVYGQLGPVPAYATPQQVAWVPSTAMSRGYYGAWDPSVDPSQHAAAAMMYAPQGGVVAGAGGSAGGGGGRSGESRRGGRYRQGRKDGDAGGKGDDSRRGNKQRGAARRRSGSAKKPAPPPPQLGSVHFPPLPRKGASDEASSDAPSELPAQGAVTNSPQVDSAATPASPDVPPTSSQPPSQQQQQQSDNDGSAAVVDAGDSGDDSAQNPNKKTYAQVAQVLKFSPSSKPASPTPPAAHAASVSTADSEAA